MNSSKASPFGGVYQNKKVLVTGHTGFKGAWLTLWLEQLGAEVKGFSLAPPTQPNLFDAAGIKDRIEHTIGDVRDYHAISSAVKSFQPEMVFHLAAQSLVSESFQTPMETFETNAQGVIHVLEAVRGSDSVRSLVVVTTDKCYKNKPVPGGYKEGDELGGSDPYSASKSMAELGVASYTQSFFREKGVGAASARAGNVIGGCDFGEDRLTPDCVRAFKENKPVRLRNPSYKRPWQYVLAPLSGYLLLGEKLYSDPAGFSGAWNFGPPERDCIRVEKMVEKIISHWGSGRIENPDNKHGFPESEILTLNWEKAEKKLLWGPVFSLDHSIGETIRSYKALFEGEDLLALCLTQIQDYMEEAGNKQSAWTQ